MIEKFKLRQGLKIKAIMQQTRRSQGPRVKEILDIEGMKPEELRTVIEHGVVMSNTHRIMLKHLPGYLSGVAGGLAAPRILGQAAGTAGAGVSVEQELPSDLNLEKMERRFIEEALQRTGNHRTQAAELLGLSRRTMQRKLAEMGMLIRKSRSTEAED